MLGSDTRGNVDRSVWEAQVILNKLGAPLPVDKTFGPITQRTWSLLATSLGLDPRFERVSSTVASLNKNTYATLLDAYILRKAPKPVGANDFERLNNAIVRMPSRMPGSKAAGQLAEDWSRGGFNYTQAINDLTLGSTFQNFWERYGKVWSTGTTDQKSTMEHPSTIKPGGALTTFTNMWTDTLEAARAAGAAAVAASKAKLKALLQEAGSEFGKGAAGGAASDTEQRAFMWGLIAAAGFGIWYVFRQERRAR